MPERVQVPVPVTLLVTPPGPEITPDTSPSPMPCTTRLLAPLATVVTLPETVSLSPGVSETMRVAVTAAVMSPDQVLLPLMLRRAPSPATPPPLRFSNRDTVTPPWSWMAPPEATVTVETALPRAVAFCTLRAPAVTVVVPV